MKNRVQLIGNLGKDPEVKNITNSGTQVANFSIATSETYKDKNGERQTETQWHNCVCWGLKAELAEKYLKKGSYVGIEGKLIHRSWEKDGEKRYATEVVVQEILFLDKKEGDLPF